MNNQGCLFKWRAFSVLSQMMGPIFLLVVPYPHIMSGLSKGRPRDVEPAIAGQELVGIGAFAKEGHQALELALVLGADVSCRPHRCCEFLTPPTRALTRGLRKPELMMIGPTSRRAGSSRYWQPYFRLNNTCTVGRLSGYFSRLRNSVS